MGPPLSPTCSTRLLRFPPLIQRRRKVQTSLLTALSFFSSSMKSEQEDSTTTTMDDPDPATAAAIAAALNEPPTTRATRSSKRTATEALPQIEDQTETKKVKSSNSTAASEEGRRPKGMWQLLHTCCQSSYGNGNYSRWFLTPHFLSSSGIFGRLRRLCCQPNVTVTGSRCTFLSLFTYNVCFTIPQESQTKKESMGGLEPVPSHFI